VNCEAEEKSTGTVDERAKQVRSSFDFPETGRSEVDKCSQVRMTALAEPESRAVAANRDGDVRVICNTSHTVASHQQTNAILGLNSRG
jgi:hypothetical protein